MTRDFMLDKYAHLCEVVQSLSRPVMTIRQFLEVGQPENPVIVLRHDIDRSLPSALRMAELEADYGFRATYYARMTRAVFRPAALRRLDALGHEVGYHYEVLARAKGDKRQAIATFGEKLEQVRRVVPVHTVSMHGSPLSSWNNLDLWQTYDFRDFGLIGEASLSIDYSSVYYFTDTGRSWDATRYNLRDHVGSREPAAGVHSTDDLIGFLTETRDRPIIINAHPNRWAGNWLSWSVSAVSDWMINQAKWLISMTRR